MKIDYKTLAVLTISIASGLVISGIILEFKSRLENPRPVFEYKVKSDNGEIFVDYCQIQDNVLTYTRGNVTTQLAGDDVVCIKETK